MRFHYLGLAIVYATCAFADYQTVNDDISDISDLLTTLDTHAKAVTAGVPGLPFALQVQVDAVNLDKRILTGFNDANDSAPFGGVGSLAVGLSLIQLEPQITQTLKDVAANNASFGELGIIVLSSLYQLKQDTDLFASAVVAKLDSLEAALAPAIESSIDAAFDSAIAAYNTSST